MTRWTGSGNYIWITRWPYAYVIASYLLGYLCILWIKLLKVTRVQCPIVWLWICSLHVAMDVWQRRATAITLFDWLFRYWSHISRGTGPLTCNTDRQQHCPIGMEDVVVNAYSTLLMRALTNQDGLLKTRFRGVPNQLVALIQPTPNLGTLNYSDENSKYCSV